MKKGSRKKRRKEEKKRKKLNRKVMQKKKVSFLCQNGYFYPSNTIESKMKHFHHPQKPVNNLELF